MTFALTFLVFLIFSNIQDIRPVTVVGETQLPLRLRTITGDISLCVRDTTSEALLFVSPRENHNITNLQEEIYYLDEQIKNYVISELPNCRNLNIYRGYIIGEPEISVETQITDNDVSFVVYYPVELSFAGGRFRLEETYHIDYKINLRNFIYTKQTLLKKEVSEEKLSLDMLKRLGFDVNVATINNHTLFYTLKDVDSLMKGNSYDFVFLDEFDF